MLSSVVLSLLALGPLALAAPSPAPASDSTKIERRGFGGLGYGYGGGWGGYGFGGRNRFRAERFRKHKNKALIAAERKHRLNLDKEQALKAKNYKEVNLDLEKDRKFDNADVKKAKAIDLAKEQALRKNVKFREGGGDFWKRQFDDDESTEGYDVGSDDTSPLSADAYGAPDAAGSTDYGNYDRSASYGDVDSVGQDGLGFGGGLYDGGLYDGGFDGGIGGGGFDFLGNDNGDGASPADAEATPDSSEEETAATPDLDQASPASNGADVDQQPDSGSLTKRSFGHGGFGYGGGYGGIGGFGRESFRKNEALRNAKLVRLAEIERARRRKALDRARVRFNTKKFNELKFKNNLHINEDDKAKEIALKDRKNIEEERIKKNGGWF